MRYSLSVPSSSGHRFQHFVDGSPHLPECLSVPSSSGHRFQLVFEAPSRLTGFVFQSPLHRGTGFNPWKLHGESLSGTTFSPLFIGAQVSTVHIGEMRPCCICFQSPLHRGTGFNSSICFACDAIGQLSVPSSSGHRFQRTRNAAQALLSLSFSPLFIGAQVSTMAERLLVIA